MAAPLQEDTPRTADKVLAIIKTMDVEERERLFKSIDYRLLESRTVNYDGLAQQLRDVADQTVKKVTAYVAKSSAMLAELQNKLSRFTRTLDMERFERGMLILKVHQDGVVWKKMPSHILEHYPDWFPQYRERRPTAEEKKRLEETLRKMARDVARRNKSK